MGMAEPKDREVATEVARRVMAGDQAAQRLGITLEDAGPGAATLAMQVREEMTQGHGTCHGGALVPFSDTAFAVACNSHDERAVAQHCAITYLAPAALGDFLLATAVERVRRGRSGVYDVTVTRQDGTVIAEFRGHSRTVGGRWLDGG